MNAMLQDFQTNWMVYASMPLIAALIGYVTKLVAIRMMFQPLEFVGKKPYLGWQGIVPRRAARMASIAVDTMTDRLISASEVMGRLDPERVVKEIEQPLLAGVEEIAAEIAQEFQPGLWENLPEQVRSRIVRHIQAEAPGVVASLLETVKNDVDAVFDLKDMVVTNLVRDKALLNRIFQHAGRKEFQFIARSGIVFGFVIGFVQMFAWAALKNPWVMPIFGGLTGWFTDWLALKMIFNPKKPTRYLGIFEWQGLFLKRRKEVAADYGDLIAREIITPKNVMEAVLRGPLSDRLFALVAAQVRTVIDKQSGPARPLVMLAVGSGRYQAIKNSIAEKVIARLPETMTHIESYAEDAMDIRNTLVTKMQEMSEDEFEELIRPAFEQDEWILITVGAVLGFCVGELQVILVENLAH
ncbi:Uncharacterized membrane protein YheB, UPF0754 family [Actinokineospora alba]|uniref:Uncharacterized membrane protein YheB, UPF0754 family n=1 Tax=Actinokineospora alba TaxID=504798 RepID=A0A1H0SQ97_9PSEU|nr:DUF445 domain-containing protein [Actinokineospora alba]TDP66589.1 uncharacterized membrane protein YheB (UPF0754 family) [Actinokineospora alba]SDJ38433.1 Uncharacterized membrane protein YheB, UPF0754 family [Actinokineospora alba]SDP43952.1 Uncharacterized membrane protein YheB, UPF0754 family [Actinokineospora alba]